ncbi:MAG: BlaI/MecI/CopY family transcriptional regulator [Planctomycetota bacterium]
MPPSSYRVTETELAVVDQLWRHGEATIRQLTDALYPGGGASQYATVQKLLERLEAKELVGRDRTAVPHVFRTTIEREQMVGHELQEVASKLCEGSLTPLLLNLVKEAELSADDRDVLRRLLDDHREKERS